MAEIYRDKIGYLSYEDTLQFSDGSISPLPGFDIASEYVNERANKDGYFYPPIVETYRKTHKVTNNILETHREINSSVGVGPRQVIDIERIIVNFAL